MLLGQFGLRYQFTVEGAPSVFLAEQATSGWARNGSETPKNGEKKKVVPDSGERVKRTLWAILGVRRPVSSRFRPISAREASVGGSHLHGPNGPEMAQNHPKRLR